MTHPPGRRTKGFLACRLVAVCAVLTAHLLAIVMLARGQFRHHTIEANVPLEVTLLQEIVEEPVTPVIPLRFEVALPVDVVLPTIDLPADVQSPPVITVVAHLPPPNPSPEVAHGPVPVVIDVVDYVRPPKPHYPASAKRARLQGIVMLRVLIDREGRPVDVRIYRSSGSEQLDAAAKESVLEALFRPYRENGEARTAQVIIPIEFSLTVRTASRS